MKRLLPILCLICTPALAQQAPASSPAEQAYQAIAHQALEREAAALARVAALQEQLQKLQAEKTPAK